MESFRGMRHSMRMWAKGRKRTRSAWRAGMFYLGVRLILHRLNFLYLFPSLYLLFPMYFQCVQNFQVEALGLVCNEECWDLCGATQPEGNHSNGTIPWTGRNIVMGHAWNLTMPSKSMNDSQWLFKVEKRIKLPRLSHSLQVADTAHWTTLHVWLLEKIVLHHKDLLWNSNKANCYRILFLITIREGGSNIKKKKYKCLQLLASK